MKEERKIYDNGVIIGRFQIHRLHDAHKELFEEVLSRQKKVLVFLGISPVKGTNTNPLDFLTRKIMLEEEYGDRISAILPLHDKRSDEIWSKQVDERIGEVFPMGSTVLYGSRDSFIPHYKGKHDTCNLEPTSMVSATEIRKEVSKVIEKSVDFRAGVIYGLYNTYPTVFSTVDIAIYNDEGQLLLGRKPLEDKFRFVGGFVDIEDDSFEMAAKREAKEETGLEVDDFHYIMSTKVDDWRYRNTTDRCIMTHFFTAKRIFGHAKAGDDIVEIRWFNPKEITEDMIVSEHYKLLQSIK